VARREIPEDFVARLDLRLVAAHRGALVVDLQVPGGLAGGDRLADPADGQAEGEVVGDRERRELLDPLRAVGQQAERGVAGDGDGLAAAAGPGAEAGRLRAGLDA